MKRIVIVGGMGPQASLGLHQRIIAGAAKLGAKDNNDYPLIVHLSIPVQDFIGEQDGLEALELLKNELNRYNFSPTDRVVMTCNTAHLLLSELEKFTGVKFASLIEETTRSIENNDEVLGLIASPVTTQSGLYSKPLEGRGHTILVPDKSELATIERCIRAVIANDEPKNYLTNILPIVNGLRSRGAAKIIIGCTELSIILKDSKRRDIIDPLGLIADHLLNNPNVAR